MFEARKRGVIFDVGHGGGSFAWRIAVPAMKQGFPPDSISTDLHIGSMNAGMKDMLNVMSKFLAMGLSLKDVVAESTWNPAREIHHEELGNLSVGAIADVAVLRVERGDFGYTDMYGARLKGNQKLSGELTLKDGKVVYDLNGISRPDWTTLPKGYLQQATRGGTRSLRPEGSRTRSSKWHGLRAFLNFLGVAQRPSDGCKPLKRHKAPTGAFGGILYFRAITITTVGYGDVVPLSPLARFLSAMEATFGVVLLGLFVNSLYKSSSNS